MKPDKPHKDLRRVIRPNIRKYPEVDKSPILNYMSMLEQLASEITQHIHEANDKLDYQSTDISWDDSVAIISFNFSYKGPDEQIIAFTKAIGVLQLESYRSDPWRWKVYIEHVAKKLYNQVKKEEKII